MIRRIMKQTPITDLLRLQPRVILKPKNYHNCPSCQTQMTLSNDTEIKYGSPQKEYRAIYHYKCPECNNEWIYNSFFAFINN